MFIISKNVFNRIFLLSTFTNSSYFDLFLLMHMSVKDWLKLLLIHPTRAFRWYLKYLYLIKKGFQNEKFCVLLKLKEFIVLYS